MKAVFSNLKKQNKVIQPEDWYIWLGITYMLSSLLMHSEQVDGVHTIIKSHAKLFVSISLCAE